MPDPRTLPDAAPLAPPPPVTPMAVAVPRCLSCGYTLLGLPDYRCPECGRPFDPYNPDTYNTKPPFVRWRYWMPGLLTALGAAVLLYPFAVGWSGFGWATTLVVPFCAGTLLGYGVRVKWMVIPLLALVLVSGIFFALVSFSLTGVFCGMILAGIAVGPLLVGTGVGWLLRQVLKKSRFDQRWHLPMLLSLLVALVCVEIDRRLWTPPAVETVRTSTVVMAPVGRAWGGLMFYEQVPAEEPALFRWRWLGLPRPLSTTGAVKRVGGRTICVYDKGRLVKETTGVEDDDGAGAGSPRRRRLAFRVVEQGFEQHSMRLVGGSFTFEPMDDTHTRVTLETTYVPHLRRAGAGGRSSNGPSTSCTGTC